MAGRKRTTAVVAIIMAMTFLLPIYAQAAKVGDKDIAAKGAAVIDFDTGKLLYGYNEAVQRVPASMLKMMAVYVVYDAIKAGKVTMDTAIRVSSATAAFSRDMTYSNVPLTAGESYTVRKLLEVVIVRSACAATVALGEGIFGSESATVERMNNKRNSLNIRGYFVDSWGGSPENKVSPLALAWLMEALIKEHPGVLEISSMKEVRWGSGTLANTNALLTRYEGANGLKTGYTDPAGNCIIATAKRGERMLIAVVMGSPSGSSRFSDAEVLLDYGFANADRILGTQVAEPEPEPSPEPVPEPEPAPDPNPSPDPNPAGSGASPSKANLILNGEETPIAAYMINGLHYFKLRDIAFLLSKTVCRFAVAWNAEEKTIYLFSASEYTPEGNEMNLDAEGRRPYKPTPSELYLDGVLYEFESYIIDGYNYFKLRDMARLFGFGVDWIGATRTVIITTPEVDFNSGNSRQTGPIETASAA